MESPEDMLNPKQAASLLGVAAKTLKNWRNQQRGPAYNRLGHHTIRYRRGTLLEWLKSKETAHQELTPA